MTSYHEMIKNNKNALFRFGRIAKRAEGVNQNEAATPMASNREPCKDYLCLRLIQKGPFDILYVTPAFTTI